MFKFPAIVDEIYLKTKCNQITDMCLEQTRLQHGQEDSFLLKERIENIISDAMNTKVGAQHGLQLFGYNFSNYVRFSVLQMLTRHIALYPYLGSNFLDENNHLEKEPRSAYVLGTAIKNNLSLIWQLAMPGDFDVLGCALVLNHFANPDGYSTELLWRYLLYLLEEEIYQISYGFIQFTPCEMNPPLVSENFSISNSIFHVQNRSQLLLTRNENLKMELIMARHASDLLFTPEDFKHLIDILSMFFATKTVVDPSCVVVVSRLMNSIEKNDWIKLIHEEYKNYFKYCGIAELDEMASAISYLNGSGNGAENNFFLNVHALINGTSHMNTDTFLDYLSTILCEEFMLLKWCYVECDAILYSYAFWLAIEFIWNSMGNQRAPDCGIVVIPESKNINNLLTHWDAFEIFRQCKILVKPKVIKPQRAAAVEDISHLIIISNLMLKNHTLRLRRCTKVEPLEMNFSAEKQEENTYVVFEILNQYFTPSQNLEDQMEKLQELVCILGIIAKLDPRLFQKLDSTAGGWFLHMIKFLCC